ncbi:hypothetical protein E2562_016538 [Oryza meyeriana var. granulata]|uniref:DUF4283 domain-containing protein n=1 Tax=Oryza meyeriana var. granulata TaxID=110450 RepID=A0A6G1C573_9ORYZ|nr:hypothetical protein E2562_016538 [Oryza meyeriana var. granulata]
MAQEQGKAPTTAGAAATTAMMPAHRGHDGLIRGWWRDSELGRLLPVRQFQYPEILWPETVTSMTGQQLGRGRIDRESGELTPQGFGLSPLPPATPAGSVTPPSAAPGRGRRVAGERHQAAVPTLPLFLVSYFSGALGIMVVVVRILSPAPFFLSTGLIVVEPSSLASRRPCHRLPSRPSLLQLKIASCREPPKCYTCKRNGHLAPHPAPFRRQPVHLVVPGASSTKRHADLHNWWFRVHICIERLPLQAWTKEAVQRILGDICIFDRMEEDTRSRADTAAFACWVWMWNPDNLPRTKITSFFPPEAGQVLETGGLPPPSQEVASPLLAGPKCIASPGTWAMWMVHCPRSLSNREAALLSVGVREEAAGSHVFFDGMATTTITPTTVRMAIGVRPLVARGRTFSCGVVALRSPARELTVATGAVHLAAGNVFSPFLL